MIRVARYSSEVVAEAAAAFLRAGGVPAAVVGHHLAETASREVLGLRSLDVIVPASAYAALGRALIERFNSERAELDEDWELRTTPDLAMLDASFAPDCPACGAPLPMDASLERCPACTAIVDVVEEIVRRHGPEALAGCFEADEPVPEPAHSMAALPMTCPSCGAAMHDSSIRGRCPSCGSLYDRMV